MSDAPRRGDARAGHALRPHTADIAFEAWGPSRLSCLEQAVAALSSAFIATEGTEPSGTARFSLEAPDDGELLVLLLEEVLYVIEVRGAVPVRSELEESSRGITGVFRTVPAAEAELIGAVPKAISRHGLRFGADASGTWRCRATIDV